MIDRINILLKAKNITARQFAEEIGIQPSGMSHILSGRNNPSLEFIMKVMKRWPEININWLMFGKGELYVGNQESVVEDTHQETNNIEQIVQQTDDYDLFSQPVMPSPLKLSNKKENAEMQLTSQHTGTQHTDDIQISSSKDAFHANNSTDYQSVNDNNLQSKIPGDLPNENDVNDTSCLNKANRPILIKKKIVKIVVLYDDYTFAEYFPE